jgi:hypothetical protein
LRVIIAQTIFQINGFIENAGKVIAIAFLIIKGIRILTKLIPVHQGSFSSLKMLFARSGDEIKKYL